MKLVRKVHRTAAFLILLQGAGHTFVGGPMFYDALTQQLIWYAGAGFAMMFLGLLNLAPPVGMPRWFRWGTVAANALWLALMIGLLLTSLSARVVAAVLITLTCVMGSVAGVLSESERPAPDN